MLHIPWVGGHVVGAQIGLFFGEDGPFPCDGIEDEERVACMAFLVGEFHLPRDAADLGADEGDGAMASGAGSVRGAGHVVIDHEWAWIFWKVGPEGDGDGFVLVGDDVLFEEGSIEFFEVDLESWSAAIWGTKPAQFVADFVDAWAGAGADV